MRCGSNLRRRGDLSGSSHLRWHSHLPGCHHMSGPGLMRRDDNMPRHPDLRPGYVSRIRHMRRHNDLSGDDHLWQLHNLSRRCDLCRIVDLRGGNDLRRPGDLSGLLHLRWHRNLHRLQFLHPVHLCRAADLRPGADLLRSVDLSGLDHLRGHHDLCTDEHLRRHRDLWRVLDLPGHAGLRCVCLPVPCRPDL